MLFFFDGGKTDLEAWWISPTLLYVVVLQDLKKKKSQVVFQDQWFGLPCSHSSTKTFFLLSQSACWDFPSTGAMLGIMAKTPHLFFFFFLSCLALLFRAVLQPPFGSLCMDSMGVFMRLHAESWSRCLTAEACYHSAHPPPPWYFCPSPPPKPPISVLACLLLQHLVHNHPTSHFFSSRSGRNTGQGWEGCPVPTLGGSHTPREKHTRASKHTPKHMRSVSFHCWICIWAWVVH